MIILLSLSFYHKDAWGQVSENSWGQLPVGSLCLQSFRSSGRAIVTGISHLILLIATNSTSRMVSIAPMVRLY